MRKKTGAMIMALLLLLFLSFGCAPDEKTGAVRILADIPLLKNMEDSELFLDALKYFGDISAGKLELEILPGNAEERAIRLQNLRTEIMSGGGPDVFLLSAYTPAMNFRGEKSDLYQAEKRLFPDVWQAMKAGKFLPFEKYLSQANYLDVSLLHPIILDACKTEEGVTVLPISFTLPIAIYKKDTGQSMNKSTRARQGLLPGENGTDYTAYGIAARRLFSDFFGEIADYSAETLDFSKEELLEKVFETKSLGDKELAEKVMKGSELLPEECGGFLWESSLTYASLTDLDFATKKMVPIYNSVGGVTAGITVYAAINSNTEQPEESFRVLDTLFSHQIQGAIMEDDEKGNSHQTWFLYSSYGVPAREDLMKDWEHSFCQKYVSQYSGKQDNTEAFAEYTALRSEVTHARFYGTLDEELQTMYEACLEAENDEEIEKIVSQSYDTMLMILAES